MFLSGIIPHEIPSQIPFFVLLCNHPAEVNLTRYFCDKLFQLTTADPTSRGNLLLRFWR